MKIDVSTIALILLLVLPGLVAKRSRRKFAAQTFESVGPTTELGELVLFSTYAHAWLFFMLILFTVVVSYANTGSAYSYFHLVDQGAVRRWLALHATATATLVLIYLFASLITGYFVGVFSGVLSTTTSITGHFAKHPWLSKIFRHFGVFSVLEEKPISFSIFGGEAIEQNRELVFFVEIQLRDAKGFITGEVASYAVVKDEEQHRLIVLQEAQFRSTSSDPYEPMQGQQLLFDLADALTMQVFYKGVEETALEREEQ